MAMPPRAMIAFVLLAPTAGALAQAPVVPAEFPAEAKAQNAEALQARLSGEIVKFEPN
jgi:hypothetical protein